MTGTSRIGVGIVGASPGSWATAAHLPALAHLDAFAVTAVATRRPDSAAATAREHDIPHAFTDVTELAGHPDVDLVVVSVGARGHAPAVRAALAAGKHVYCEWPLAVDTAEALDLAARADRAGVVHAVGLQGYQSPSARFVGDLLAAGRIGRVDAVSAIVSGAPLGGHRIFPDLTATLDPASGGTFLSVMAGHLLGTLDGLVGAPESVSAVIANRNPRVTVDGTDRTLDNPTPGQLALAGTLAGGAVLSATVHGGPSTPDSFLIRITGTGGSLTITPDRPGQYPHWVGWNVQLHTGTDPEPLPIPDRYRTVPPGVPTGPAAHVAALYTELANAITDHRPAHPDFHTAVRLHHLLDTLARSAHTATRQTIPTDPIPTDPIPTQTVPTRAAPTRTVTTRTGTPNGATS
jgi:predicted dehydrogenase